MDTWHVNGTLVNKKRSTNINDHVTTVTTPLAYLDSVVKHPKMGKTYQCKYCIQLFPSMQEQRSHLAQAKKCHERW